MDERLAFRGDGGVSIAAPVGSATAVDSAYVNRTHRGNCQRECSTVPRQSVCCTGPHELFCVGSIFCTLCCFYTRVHSQTNSCACMHAHTHAHTHTHPHPYVLTHTPHAHTPAHAHAHTPHTKHARTVHAATCYVVGHGAGAPARGVRVHCGHQRGVRLHHRAAGRAVSFHQGALCQQAYPHRMQ